MSVLHTLKEACLGQLPSRSHPHALRLPPRLSPPAGHGDFAIRPIREDDQEEWNEVRWRNRQWLSPWDSGDPMQGPGMTYSQWMASQERDRQDGASAVFLMEFQSAIVGQISLGAICYGSMRTATVGYWVDRDHIGHDFAPLALTLLSEWALKDPNGPRLHRIEVAIIPDNQRSLRVAEKVGMKAEGLRRRYMYVNGDWRNHLTFSLLSEEFDPAAVYPRL